MKYSQQLKEILAQDGLPEDLMREAAKRGIRHLQQSSEIPPFPPAVGIKNAQKAEIPFPDKPTASKEILKELINTYGPATVNTHSGRYFGFVHGSSFPIGLATKWISTIWDQNTPLYLLSPAASIMETQVEKWLVDALHFYPETAVGFVSSTSQSLLTGIITGRDTLLSNLGWDTRKQGLHTAPKLRVVLSDQAHVAVYRALRIAGFGEKDVEVVPSDSQGRLKINRLPVLDNKTLLILQAGNLYTGAFDDYSKILPVARVAGAWVHVDGAFGLWAAASPEKSKLVKNLRDADSWSADCHKTLNTPFSCGLVLCRHRDRLIESMSRGGDYLYFGANRDGMNYTPDMARRFQAAEVWATLKFLGREGLIALVESLCECAQAIAKGLGKIGYQIVNDVVFNQVSVRLQTDQATETALKLLQDGGNIWCGGGVWGGRKVIRISVSSWRTNAEDIEKTIDEFRSVYFAVS